MAWPVKSPNREYVKSFIPPVVAEELEEAQGMAGEWIQSLKKL